MTRRAERLLEILQTLRGRRRPITAAALAERHGISDRTVYRDLDALASLGAPIRGEAGVGFVLASGFFLPPLSLSQAEADAVLLGLRFVARRGDDELADVAGTAMAKIGAGLDPDTERLMNESGLAVGPSGSGRTDHIKTIRHAMGAETKLRFTYRDARGHESQRIVWPVALGFFDETELLVAWCALREAFRHFRLDRITGLHKLDERLPVPRRILLAEYHLEEPDADI